MSSPSRDEIERMIGKRTENMMGVYIAGAILSWVATFFGIWVGYTYYPWAYAWTSGMYALIVLSVIIWVGFLFTIKVAREKPVAER